MWTFILIVIAVATWTLKQLFHFNHMRECVANLRTFPSLPLVGHIHLFFGKNSKEFFDTFHRLCDHTRQTYKLWMGPRLLVVVQEKDDLKTVLTQCLDKPFLYKCLPRLAHGGIIMAEGEFMGSVDSLKQIFGAGLLLRGYAS